MPEAGRPSPTQVVSQPAATQGASPPPGPDRGQHVGADDGPWALPGSGWVPPGSLGTQLRALLGRRLPLPLQAGRWNPGRRGVLAVAVLGALGIVFATVLFFRGRPHPANLPEPGPVPSLPAISPLPTASAPDEVLVDVEGKVRHPGVVRLPRGSRVQAALQAAGGPQPGIDTSALNLARVVADGEQLRVGLPPLPDGAPTAPTADASGGVGAPVNLNTASVADLDALPGVGPVTAQHILDWRSQHGRFTSVEQLQEVSGIGPATYAKLAPLVTV